MKPHQLGREGENRAAEHLLEAGYAILERNFRCRLGEVDLIARWGQTIVYVEVKTRRSARHGWACEAVPPGKQHRIRRIAALYQAHLSPTLDCRFDVITLYWKAGRWRLDHLQDCF